MVMYKIGHNSDGKFELEDRHEIFYSFDEMRQSIIRRHKGLDLDDKNIIISPHTIPGYINTHLVVTISLEKGLIEIGGCEEISGEGLLKIYDKRSSNVRSILESLIDSIDEWYPDILALELDETAIDIGYISHHSQAEDIATSILDKKLDAPWYTSIWDNPKYKPGALTTAISLIKELLNNLETFDMPIITTEKKS